MDFIIGLLIGIIVGICGVLCLAICAAAGNDHEYLDNPPDGRD